MNANSTFTSINHENNGDLTDILPINQYLGRAVVNARELHDFLGIKADFDYWIKTSIKDYGFDGISDYTSHKVVFANGRETTDYFITMHMAQGLSMVQLTAKGRQARRYFLAMERDQRAAKKQMAVSRYRAEIIKTLSRHLHDLPQSTFSQSEV